jgi:hypothetical protein
MDGLVRHIIQSIIIPAPDLLKIARAAGVDLESGSFCMAGDETCLKTFSNLSARRWNWLFDTTVES